MENIADDEDLIRFALEIPIDSDDESGESDDECLIDYDPIVDNNYSQNDFIEQAPSTITASIQNQNNIITPNIEQIFIQPSDTIDFDNNLLDGLEDLIPLINSEALTSPEQPRRQNRQTKPSKTAPNNIQIQPPVVSYKDINWKNGNLILNKNVTEFLGNSSLPIEIRHLISPLDFFSFFFDDELLDSIVEQSLLYSVQQNINNTFRFTKNELKKYLGIVALMSLVHLPNTRSYWNCVLGNTMIQETMSLKRFELIRRYLHFNNNETALPMSHKNYDRLHRIRPVLDHIKKKCNSIPIEENLSIDEQICPTKARSYLKQYLPLKPHKWGYKIFVLSGVSGFSYNFEVYSGLENNPDQRLQNEPNLGASANIVVRLARIIPKNQNYKLYFDNYYTTLALEVYLKKNGIYSLGTLRRNRVPGLILPDEKYLKTKPRGFSSECLAEVDGEAVTAVIWKDNKCVTLLSTLSGKLPETEVKRFDKKNKIRSKVPCPNIVGVYNKHMGGVDLLDAHIARYRVGMRSKKWYFKMFYHFFDVAMVNAWILYKKVNSDEKYMPLKDFRQEIAVSLCKIGENLTPTRGRKRKEPEQSEKKKRGYQTFKPPRDVRLDMIAHFPKITDKRERCKNNGCGKKTSIMCRKCKVYLCLNKTNDCFYDYHCPQ
ncbi:hypothetical protein AGLY_014222 [Aphis glycines]|uniref:PiggyBac transposable element-derived protein domain-containing protein n=1 Tax=Aphis glycines TaxID=307491 RepID=A0A6G0T4P9_APHGL|nr:hypothetical protein AGLY_014222 [Aphis glycines]